MLGNLPRFPPRLLPARRRGYVNLFSLLSSRAREEAKAAAQYSVDADKARSIGDLTTASLLDHIREEELHHLAELNRRIKEYLRRGK